MSHQGAHSLIDGAVQDALGVKRGVQAALDLYGDPKISTSSPIVVLQKLEEVKSRIQQLKKVWPAIEALQEQALDVSASPDAGGASAWIRGTTQYAGKVSQLLDSTWCGAVSRKPSVWASTAVRSTKSGEQGVEELEAVVARVSKVAAHLTLQFCSPHGHVIQQKLDDSGRSPVRHAEEVYVHCPGVFSASIALSAPGVAEPLRVAVDGPAEGSHLDPWGSSRRQVFKRISALSTAALSYFYQQASAQALLDSPSGPGTSSCGPSPSALVLECLLLWLAQYQDLFTRPCRITGKLLCWEPATAIPLPPVLRPFKLTLPELRAAAENPGLRQAYHLHLAPKHLLELGPSSTFSQPPPSRTQLVAQYPAAAAVAAAPHSYVGASGGPPAASIPPAPGHDRDSDMEAEELEMQLRAELFAAGLLLPQPSSVPPAAVTGGEAQAGQPHVMLDAVLPVVGGLPAPAAVAAADSRPGPIGAGCEAPPATGAAPVDQQPHGTGAGLSHHRQQQPQQQRMLEIVFQQHQQLQAQQQQQEQQLQQQQHQLLQAQQRQQEQQQHQTQQLGQSYNQQAIPTQQAAQGAGYPAPQQQEPQQRQQPQQRQYPQQMQDGAQQQQQHQQQYQQQLQTQQQAQTVSSPLSSPGAPTRQATTGSVIAAALQAADAAAASAVQAVPSDPGQQPIQMNMGMGYGIPGSMPMLQQPQQQYGGAGAQLPLSYMPPGSSAMPASSQQQQQPLGNAQQQHYLQYQQLQQPFQSYQQKQP